MSGPTTVPQPARPGDSPSCSDRNMMGPMTNGEKLRSMVTGFRISAALSVAAELGLSDRLAGGPRSVPDLAAATSADIDSLNRLMRALATIGVYEEQQDGSFANTTLGEGLCSDVPGSVRPLARTLQDPAVWSAWDISPTVSSPVRTPSRLCTASTSGPIDNSCPHRTRSSTTT